MGWRYTRYRATHQLAKKLGLFHRRFPTYPPVKNFLSLADWRSSAPKFLINGRLQLDPSHADLTKLKKRVDDLKDGKFEFFSSQIINIGTDYNWTTHPITDYDFGNSKHFADIADLSKETGDIKYVWEKARFGFLQDLMRYDSLTSEDQSNFVLSEIEDFIDNNPINRGPNYICSQEISLRIFNWTYALYYYKDSDNLTEGLFAKIMNSIYWQLHHVHENINFSRIAVRNNHAITETLMLWVSGVIFPFIPESKMWSAKGKKWFEDEIDYQIYDNGTYLQFSMNYHRVVVQLLTIALSLGRLHGVRFRESVYSKTQSTLDFLYNCLQPQSNHLPNYGSNDGALFFIWTDRDYRDYRTQLDDLNQALNNKRTETSDSGLWYGLGYFEVEDLPQERAKQYLNGGYSITNDTDGTKTFFCNSSYTDRPAQSDNLHLDIWDGERNLLWDPGSYLYNAPEEVLQDFLSSKAHNTITIDGDSHMKKASRFIWNYWIKSADTKLEEDDHSYRISASCVAYRWNNKGILLRRSVVKNKSEKQWVIIDQAELKKGQQLLQHWQINPDYEKDLDFQVTDADGKELEPKTEKKWCSSYYGVKTPSIRYTFATSSDKIITQIKITSS